MGIAKATQAKLRDALARSDTNAVRRLVVRPGVWLEDPSLPELPIVYAAREGYLDLVISLLDCGADIEARSAFNYTALHMAVKAKEDEIMRLLLCHGADPNSKDRCGRTPLIVAAGDDYIQGERILIQYGAHVSARDTYGYTAMAMAASLGAADSIQYLASRRRNVNEMTDEGQTPLMLAVENCNFDAVCTLLDCGASVSSVNSDCESVVHIAERKQFASIALKLLDVAEPTLKNRMLSAVEDGDVSLVRRMTSSHRCLVGECGDSNEYSPLVQAVRAQQIEMVRLLLELDAPANAKHEGCKPLHVAAALGDVECARILLDAGADVEGRGPAGRTPILYAANCGSVDMCTLLIDAGANVNATRGGFDNATALAVAASAGHHQVVMLMLDRGADVDQPDRFRDTPMLRAVRARQIKVIRLLVQHGASCMFPNMDGVRPLSLAWYIDDPEVLGALTGTTVHTRWASAAA